MNGFACNEGDIESYFNGTLSLVLDNSRRKTMSNEGRQFSLRFEKRTVCRRMIDNYAHVTNEFYGLYRGNHSNRDREYESKPDSFLGGSYVRPTSLILVEYVFIFIFQIAYRLAEIILYASRCITSIRARKRRVTAAETVVRSNDSMSLLSSSNSSIASDLLDSPINSGVAISSGLPHDRQDTGNQATAALNNISDMEDPTDGGDEDSIDGSTFSCDDTSSSTCSFASTATQNHIYKERFWRSELPFSHNLAILFIKSVRSQGRVESRIRKRYARLTLASPSNDWLVTGKKKKCRIECRKRKCSEDLKPDDLEGTSMLALQLKESLLPIGSSCSSTDSCGGSDHSLVEDIDITITSTNVYTSRAYAEHGLNSRRVKSSSNMQV